jgi:hypothetical protein
MNPEDLNLPQPPEGILDPQIPWSYVRPQSPLWNTLKARLTGRPTNGEHYSSYVNLTEADADRLIENLKKDPRGYPSLDQSSGTPIQWMERQQKYQEWLVEEYLENPFREQTNKKIEEAEQKRRLQEIQEQKRKAKEEQEEREKRKQEQVKPPEVSVPVAPVAPAQEPVAPPPPPPPPPEPPKPKAKPLRDEDLTIPYQMPANVSRAMAKYGDALDKIGNELSHQNSILTRRLGYLRRIDEDLDDVKFLLEQLGENYQEALDDFEIEQRKKDARKKFVSRLISPIKRKKKEPSSSTPPKQDKPWWNIFGGGQQQSPPKKLAAGGYTPTGVGDIGKIITPGIYTNPVRGVLPPGMVVIPRNRNSGKQMLNLYDTQSHQQALGEVMQGSMRSLLGAGVVMYGSILRALGPLAGYFNQNIPGIVSGVSNILGISTNAVLNMLGGSAYAGTMPNEKEDKAFYKMWKAYMDKNNLYFPGGVNAPGDARPDGQGEGQDSGGAEVEWAGGLEYAPPSNPFADTDGQETGIDISLKGKGSNGYGQGLTIRNPIDNLYYFSKVPKGFQNPGSPTRGIQGTAQRVAKGRGPSGFGHWATYYIKDADGTFYELMIGHLDRPAPTWNDTGNGVLLNKGVKIGIQGASGSSVGATPDGTYDHMTTHINSPGRRNPGRSGQLLIQWARALDAYKPSTMPQQPPIARRQGGGFLNMLGRILPGTGTVMAPRSSGPKDRQGIRQTLVGYQNKLLGIVLGRTSYPKGSHGEYSQQENRRYYERTGRYFIPTDFGPGYLPGIHGLYTPPNDQRQVRPQGAITSTNNQQLRNAIQNARDITNMPGGGAYKPLVESAAGTAIKQQKYYDTLRETMRDAGMQGADENMDIYGNLKNKRKPKLISMTLPSATSTNIQSSPSPKSSFANMDIPTKAVMQLTQMRNIS